MTENTPEPLWQWSATRTADAIRRREVSSREVVTALVERIEAVDPRVNAATVVFADRALAAADAADRRTAAGDDLGPLHGVGFSVKENVDLTWSATTHGVPLFKDLVPEQDAVDVARLRAAGAIPVLRTNMPDLGMRWHTDNDLFGATLNPWDPTRTPGGSSGGEGVAVATGMSQLGVGNDYGGSIRLPAHANGVCGLKPTPGRIPMWRPGPGVFPPTAQMFSVQGPLARTVDDVALAYGVMAGPDVVDTLSLPVADDPYPGAPRRIAVVADRTGVAAHVVDALRRAANALAAAGWEVEQADPPRLTEAAQLWRELVVSDTHSHLFDPASGLAQHCSAGTRRHAEQLAAHTRRLTLAEYGAAWSRRQDIRSAWSEFSRRYPVVLAPVVTELPFTVGRDIAGADEVDALWHEHRMLVAVSCLGLPSLAMPVGDTSSGMPQGVQLIGAAFGERQCLSAGRDLERVVGAMTPIEPRAAVGIV